MIDSVIATARPILRRYARVIPEQLRDDATQEAIIEIWRNEAAVMAADNPTGYAIRLGKRAVARFAPERPATGAPARSRGSGRLFTRQTQTISSDALLELTRDTDDPYFTDALKLSDDGGFADLDTRLDVAAAMLTLDDIDFEIVYDRFWEGLTWREIGENVGLSTSGVFNRWERTTRPALASALGV